MASNSNHFPSTLAELTFRDTTDSTSLYRSIRDIRKSTLSITNRLTSIVRDARFVQDVADTYSLPIIANERCGSWYINPRFKAGSAYFKSTDGHHGQWSFSLRRLNLQVLSVIGQHGGAIIVDSTRRGKNMPDALLKTVPIWVAVMNRTLFPSCTDLHTLQHPPQPDDLGLSEISQIEGKIHGFVASFRALQLDLNALTNMLHKPILIQWVVNGNQNADQIKIGWGRELPKVQDCNLLILCSASKRVVGAEVSEGGYIQGAGDDSEGWAHGLTPKLFWQHQQALLRVTAEEELLATIAELVVENTQLPSNGVPKLINPTSTLYLGPTRIESGERFELIIHCNANAEGNSKTFLGLGCREGKLGSRDLRDKLLVTKDFVKAVLLTKTPRRILVTCTTCKDLSVGVAVMLLCLFYNQGGCQEIDHDLSSIDKALIKKRLAWISSSMPDVNPSRATLQSVNAFLMPRSL